LIWKPLAKESKQVLIIKTKGLVVAADYNLSFWEAEGEDNEFQDRLGSIFRNQID
jgi:hypothetical protein